MKQTNEFRKLASEVLWKEVSVPELSVKGRIVSVFIGDFGVQYNVRYFINGEAKMVYMFDLDTLDTEKKDVG